MDDIRAVHLRIAGRVQGVGYRAWFEREAQARDLNGWVRNHRDGSVEALVAGDAPQVGALIEASRRGPAAAVVADVTVGDAIAPGEAGFAVLPTA